MTSLIGELRVEDEVFVLIKYAFKKNSQAYILLHTSVEGVIAPRYQDYYRSGGRLEDPAWIAGILDTVQNKSYGSTFLLEALLEEVGGELSEVNLKTASMGINLSVPSMRLNLAVQKLDAMLESLDRVSVEINLADRKKERGPIKGINFGRTYLTEVWKTCHKIFDGKMTPKNLAKTAYLLEFFDRARAPVNAALNAYRGESVIRIIYQPNMRSGAKDKNSDNINIEADNIFDEEVFEEDIFV